MDDLSGLEPADNDWIARDEIPETLSGLLAEAGKTYVPVLLANAKAVDAGTEQVRAEVEGQAWVQQPFPYQAKCLQWVRQEYARLDSADRAVVDGILGGTGCEALF